MFSLASLLSFCSIAVRSRRHDGCSFDSSKVRYFSHTCVTYCPLFSHVFRRTEPLRFATRPELREYAHFRYIHWLPVMRVAGTQNLEKWLDLGLLLSEKLLAKSMFHSRLGASSAWSSRSLLRYVNIIIGILSEDQAGKGLSLKDLEKLSKMVSCCKLCSHFSRWPVSDREWLCVQVNKVCLSVKKAVGRKAKEGQKKSGKGALQMGDELGYDDFEDVGGEDDY
jgi:hypothetical protein